MGDIESLPFLEAIRQLKSDLGRERTLYIHVTLVPYIDMAGELKTKPTQHSVKELRSLGIQPDIIVCRSGQPLDDDLKSKIALFCDTLKEAVIQNGRIQSKSAAPSRGRTRFHSVRRLGLRCDGPDVVLETMVRLRTRSQMSGLHSWASMCSFRTPLSVTEALRMQAS